MTDEIKTEEVKIEGKLPPLESVDIQERDIKWREKLKISNTELEKVKAHAAEETKKYEEKISSVSQQSKNMEKRVIDAELKAQAIAAGLQDLDFIKLIDASEIKLSEDGKIEGLEKAVNDFKVSKPALFAAEKRISSSKNEKLPTGDEKVETTDALKMTPEEFAKAKTNFGRY